MADAREIDTPEVLSPPATVPADALPTPAQRAHPLATDIALVSSFAAFIAVCAIVPSIPTGANVPITLQTFAVVLAGLVLGWRRGALAVLLYLAVGFAGVPVFADGRSGLGVLAGASVGYLLAFPFAAALAGLIAGQTRNAQGSARFLVLFASGVTASALTIHPAGIAGLMVRLDLTFPQAFAADAIFVPGDIVKNLAAAAVALAVFSAYPDLLRHRR